MRGLRLRVTTVASRWNGSELLEVEEGREEEPSLLFYGHKVIFAVCMLQYPFNSVRFGFISTVFQFYMAGLPALQGSEPGQVRKEAATAIFCKCRGSGSPPVSFEKMVDVQ